MSHKLADVDKEESSWEQRIKAAERKGSFLVPNLHAADAPDPAQTKYFRSFAHRVIRGTTDDMETMNRYLKRGADTVFWMSLGLFVMGISATVVGLILVARGSNAASTAPVFGLSAVSFVTVFLMRPYEAMERSGILNSWLLSIVNTYWLRLYYANDLKSIEPEIQSAQREMSYGLKQLTTAYGDLLGKYQAVPDDTGSTSTSDGASVKTVAEDTTLTTSDKTVIVTADGKTITLVPAKTAGSGAQVLIKNGPAVTTTTVSAGSDEIDGSANPDTITGKGGIGEYQSDGSQWWRVSGPRGSDAAPQPAS